MSTQIPVSLPEEEYLKIIDIMGQLYQCRVKKDLKRCIENKVMPLIKAQTAGYAWVNIEVWKGMVKPAQTIDMIGIPPSQWPWIEKAHPYLVSTHELFQKSQRCVIAHDVDFPRDQLKKELQRFADDHPDFEPSKVFGFADYVSHLVIGDRENDIGVGFHRNFPNEEPWTRQEIRVMELLRPSLLSAIKRVAIQEQLQTYRKLTEALAENEAPCALVQEDGRVLFRNPAFQHLVPVDSGGLLPKELRDVFEQQVALLDPGHKPETAVP